MKFEKFRKIHCIGIGGIGISALAKWFHSRGITVSGSDQNASFITDDLKKKGVEMFIGHDAKHLDDSVDLIVYSSAVPEGNPERTMATARGIRQMSYNACLGELSKLYTTIAIAGNKGKTTTTAMLGLMLEAAGLDPTVIVGSIVKEWKSNFRGGKGEFLVVEACEFRDHFLLLHPTYEIITNIEPDHMDYFQTFDNEIASFQQFLDKIRHRGFAVINADDPILKDRIEKSELKTKTFGFLASADLKASKGIVRAGKMCFDLTWKHEETIQTSMRFPGDYNIANAAAASLMALELGVESDAIAKTLMRFQSTWRRFELLGQYRGASVISDYAHHPSALRSVLAGAKEFYPEKKVIAIFQPHHHHRTKELFLEFVSSFDDADAVIMSEIFHVIGRDDLTNADISSKDLVSAIRARDKEKRKKRSVQFAENLSNIRDLVSPFADEKSVLLFLGAGDIYREAENVVRTC